MQLLKLPEFIWQLSLRTLSEVEVGHCAKLISRPRSLIDGDIVRAVTRHNEACLCHGPFLKRNIELEISVQGMTDKAVPPKGLLKRELAGMMAHE